MMHVRLALSLAFFSICFTTALAKRSAPVQVDPVTHEGIEYSAPRDAGSIGQVQARDAGSKKVLWEQVIYQISYDPDLERDVQWVFISDLKIEGDFLIITDERKRCYSLNLKTRKVGKKVAIKPVQAAAYAASIPKPTLSEVAYGEHQRHVLDFWKAESDQPTPLVFVIHGGGWRNGSKERLSRFVDAAALLKAGISVVAINYRYTKNATDLKPLATLPR